MLWGEKEIEKRIGINGEMTKVMGSVQREHLECTVNVNMEIYVIKINKHWIAWDDSLRPEKD